MVKFKTFGEKRLTKKPEGTWLFYNFANNVINLMPFPYFIAEEKLPN